MTDHLKTIMAACWEFQCCHCSCPLPRLWEVEHLTPRCRGGTDELPNLAPSCPRCNLVKGIRTATEFRRNSRAPDRARRIATLLSAYGRHEHDARCVVRRIIAAVRVGRREGALRRG